MHGAALSAAAGKVRPHLGDFLSDPGSHRVAVNMQHRLLCHRYFPPYHPAFYGTQSAHNAQLTHEFRNVKFCIYVWWRITSFNMSGFFGLRVAACVDWGAEREGD